jgi:hypothetical protein
MATKKDFTSTKYLIFLLPQVLLLFVWGFQGLEKQPLRPLVGGFYGMIVAVALFHFYAMPVDYGRRLNWRAAAEQLKRELNNETPLVLIEGSGYPLLRYYGIETSCYWLTVGAPQGSVEPNDYTQSLRKRLHGKREVFYLREDEMQNAVDPSDTVLKALRLLGTEETHITYNPRLTLYRWRLHQELSSFKTLPIENSTRNAKNGGGGLHAA